MINHTESDSVRRAENAWRRKHESDRPDRGPRGDRPEEYFDIREPEEYFDIRDPNDTIDHNLAENKRYIELTKRVVNRTIKPELLSIGLTDEEVDWLMEYIRTH
jgi:hypothetical protein